MSPVTTQRPARYGAPAIALHWVLGLAIVVMLVAGWYMTGLPFSPQRLKLYNWHKWAGMAVLASAAATAAIPTGGRTSAPRLSTTAGRRPIPYS